MISVLHAFFVFFTFSHQAKAGKEPAKGILRQEVRCWINMKG